MYIGIDTSCYTTSVACVGNEGIVLDERTVLSVPMGHRGLRQSEMLFQHTRNVPVLIDKIFSAIDADKLEGIGVSKQPTSDTDSYMPAFLSGIAVAKSIAGARNIPLIETNHQIGHFRAAIYHNEALLQEKQILGFHISGGTTDVVLISIDDGIIQNIQKVAEGNDLHAGQLVDRIGVALNLPFPCGKHLERLAQTAKEKNIKVPSSVKNGDCSFSGVETYLARELEKGVPDSEVAYGLYDCLSRTFSKMVSDAMEKYKCTKVLFAGGVSSSSLLRQMLEKKLKKEADLYFGFPELSSDNAVGVAFHTKDILCRNR